MEKYSQLFNTEDKSLELRLGPPGEDRSLLFTGCNENKNNNNNNSSHGAKRVFQEIMMSIACKAETCSDKKACSGFGTVSVTANTAITNGSSKRTAIAPVVGWPPIGSFRKNVASTNLSKPAAKSPNGTPKEGSDHGKSQSFKNNQLFVKISMEGVPIGRKINLSAYDGYEELSFAIDELFKDLLAAQRDSSGAEIEKTIEKTIEQSKAVSGSLARCDEYTLVYEDNEGDRILVGDVPWHMFVSTVKKLLVLKTSERSTL